MMTAKIRLGKTGTSRSRKKNVVEGVSSKLKLPPDDFTKYLLQKGYSDTTIAGFVGNVNQFSAWLEKESMEIENIGYNDMTGYLQSLGNITQHTKGCYLRGVKQYFNFLIHQGQRTDNPAAFIQLKGIKRKTLYDILSRQELDSLYHNYTLPDEQGKDRNQNWFKAKALAYKRNKVVLGLLLYQGLDSKDFKLLGISDIQLREGKIRIPGTRRSNERELKLEAMQIMDMMDYLATTRHEILQLTGKQTQNLFSSIGTGERFHSILHYLLRHLRQLNPRVRQFQQLRASVIVHWLKLYNLRQVQYMAGHRYVSSTEQFLVNEMEGMIEEIEKYHPIG
jgi:site-specific recombinase XerD